MAKKQTEETKVDVVEEAKVEMAVATQQEKSFMQQQDLGSFYSLSAETRAEKVKLYNAITNPEERLGDHINTAINVKDVLIEVIELVQEETGELQPVPRTILIAEDGTTYVAVSIGIFQAVKRVINLFGEPTWKEPVEMKIKQITKGDRKMLTLELV